MNENVTVGTRHALDLLDVRFITDDFSPNSIKTDNAIMFETVMPFFDALIDQYFIECVDEEAQLYKVTNRGRFIISMDDADIVEDVILTDNQKKTLIIMSLMDGKVSSADNSFNPHQFCDFEDLITKKFVMTDRDSDNWYPFVFWLSKKGEQFAKKHCIIL
ncbi:MAG: hypothetical protein ACKUBY_03270 [Candidatus Moraniibacteriota bacterium]|jgi:hypothetical protein